MNSSPVMVSFSYRYRASSSSFSRFSERISVGLFVLALHQLHHLPVDLRRSLGGAGQGGVAPQVLIVALFPGPPCQSQRLMPYRVIMARASLVACSMSLEAPVEAEWKTSSSAARPPVSVAILFSSSSWLIR